MGHDQNGKVVQLPVGTEVLQIVRTSDGSMSVSGQVSSEERAVFMLMKALKKVLDDSEKAQQQPKIQPPPLGFEVPRN
jgi:hypothetical protein